MKKIYTDGACENVKQKIGGWAWVCYDDKGNVTQDFGGAFNTTNNRMEMTAAIRALESNKDKNITIYSDSEYLVNGMTKWLKSWIAKGKLETMKNPDLWKMLSVLVAKRNIKWTWIKGHAGNEGNETADCLAQLFVEQNCGYTFEQTKYKKR